MSTRSSFAVKDSKAPARTREQRRAEKQTLALWALLGNGGAGIGSAMKPEIQKAEREALLGAGLISVEKQSRSYRLEVTDRGWRWAEEHLADALPERTYASAFVLRAWLTRLQSFMQARDIGLAEVLTPRVQSRQVGDHTRRAEDSVSAQLDYSALRERIRKAYLDVTRGSFNTRALLSDIRARLANINRDSVDDALKRMQREDEASLMQLDNAVEITEADRRAALYVGHEPRHILWISR